MQCSQHICLVIRGYETSHGEQRCAAGNSDRNHGDHQDLTHKRIQSGANQESRGVHGRTVAIGRAAAPALARIGLTVRPMIKLQTALLIPALMSIALAVPVSIALADPDAGPSAPTSEGTDPGSRATRSTPATITVTATVAPGQCQPVSGGPAATQVTDTAGPPIEPSVIARQAALTSEAKAPASSDSSRFDPYTCAPVPVDSTSLTAAPSTSVIPSYTPTLNPYPGQNGSGAAGSSGSGSVTTSDPLSAPTTSRTIAPAQP